MQKQTIYFSRKQSACLIRPATETSPQEIIEALDLPQPRSLLLISGAGQLSEQDMQQLTCLFRDGVMPVAIEAQALIIDGGTQTGVMKAIGMANAEQGQKISLVGVSPGGQVTYPGKCESTHREVELLPLDPNHSHFVLLDSNQWGDETSMMFALAEILAREIPVITILYSGGSIARNEVLQSVRRAWPLLVLEGSGRLADEIATAVRTKPASFTDKLLEEIIHTGNITLFPSQNTVGDLHLLIRQMLADQLTNREELDF